MKRGRIILLGALATIALAELWHGPLGSAAGLEGRIERTARAQLDYYELPKVTARLDTKPLSRRLILEGPADPFQRRALVESLSRLPGVNEVVWAPGSPVINSWPRPSR